MKRIVLHQLTLTNWRGEKSRTTEFHADAPTCIMGGNGLGKSRHFDAFCWLLFGKDSHDRKDFELRTYDESHRPLHHCECSVEAVIGVDGQKHTIKREYKENWVKPKGQPEEVLKGNVTECTWDGVPVKVSDFQKRMSDCIIDETVFKMITNPRYFAEKMKWQLQRETLLQMAGAKTDREIAAGNADFKALLDHLNGKSLSDFRKELAAEKKRLKAEKDDIEPRIDQTQKMMPEAEDFEALKHEQDELRQELANVQKQLDNSAERDRARQDKARELNNRVNDLKTEQDRLCRNYKLSLQEDADKKNALRRSIEQKCKEISQKKSDNNIDISHTSARIAYLKNEIASLAPQLDDLRKEWFDISKTAYTGSDTCPYCGQRLPDNMMAEARSKFDTHKQELLRRNNERGKSLSSQQKEYRQELEERQERLSLLQRRDESLTDDLTAQYDKLKANPAVKPKDFTNTDVPGWQDRQKLIEDTEQQLQSLTAPVSDDDANAALIGKRTDIQNAIYALQNRLMKQPQIENGKKEMGRLQARGKELAQLIADIEKREYTAAQFSKKRIEDCEKRINGMFQLVRFQLFDYTQDGNEYETCTPLVGGVPYAVANTAGQLNAGLDIINTLCRFYNVSAPIFCDGAESVNHYIATNSQMIFLQVTNDKQLVIK